MANLGLQNNNAGNLRDPATGNFQVFKDPNEGYKALVNDLNIKKSGKSQHIQPGGSIMDLANVWAPASDNNKPADWANNVAKTVGVKPTDSWADIPTDKLAQGIQVAEGTSTPSKNPKPENLSSSGGATFNESKLSHEQLVANINAMEKQGAKPDEVQGYLDSLKTSSQSTHSDDRKSFADSIGATPAPQIQNSGTLGTNPNDSTLGKATDNSITRGLINFVPGAKTLGESIGTLGGLAYEKAKGLFGGQDNSSTYDTSAPSIGKTALAGGEYVANGLIPKGISALGGAVGGGGALASQEVSSVLSKIAGKESISALSSAEKLNGLTEAMGTADPALKTILSKAIQELGPNVLKEAGIGSFSELNPKMAKVLGLSKKAVEALIAMTVLSSGYNKVKGLVDVLSK